MNLITAIQLGYPVYCEFGCIGLYTVFLCGGVCAALPSSLYQGQQKQITKGYENIYSSLGKRYLPSFFGTTVVDGVSSWLGSATGWMLTPSLSCGSSGAVFAMMGCDLGLLCYHLFNSNINLLDLKSGKMVLFRKDGKVRTRYWTEWFTVVIDNIRCAFTSFLTNPYSLWKIIQALSMMKCLLIELEYVYDLESILRPVLEYIGLGHVDMSLLWKSTAQNKSFAEVMEGGRIGHANHIQGMLFGLAYTGVFSFTLPFIIKKFR